MGFEELVTFAIAMTVYVVTPGPGVLALVARALADGMRATIPHILGIIVANLAYLYASVYGLAWVAQQLGALFLLVKLAGGAYLIYLGVKLWHSTGEISELQRGRPKTLLATFFTGLSISASNPKAFVFYLALLPTVMDLGAVSLTTLTPIALIDVAVLILILGIYSALAAKARRIFADRDAMRRLNRSAGGVMIVAGLGVTAS